MLKAIDHKKLNERLDSMRGDLVGVVAKYGSLCHPAVVAYSRCLDAVLNEYRECERKAGYTL